MGKNKKNIDWESGKEDGIIKFFKFLITAFTFIFFCKSFENNTSFENILGISISSIYDYYILSTNDENNGIIKNYAKGGMWLYSVCLLFSLAGSLGVILEEKDYFLLNLGVVNYFKISDKIIFWTFVSILLYNVVEIPIKTKRLNINSEGEE